jgi:thiol:disulfide interchange protein DsbC
MKRIFPRGFFPVLVLIVTCLSRSDLHAAEPGVPENLAEAIRTQAPDVSVDRIRPGPVAGLYEVLSGKSIFYVDVSGRYFLSGQIYDMQEKKNLTSAAISDLQHIDPMGLPLSDAITIVRGSGKRQLFLFSDPDCPYCKRLERGGLATLDDVTIHVFLFPLINLHPDAHNKAVNIWCSKSPAQSWNGLMREDAMPLAPAVSPCENPVDRNVQLGNRLGIEATPTLIFSDGHVVTGAVSEKEMESRMGRAN